jgi:hypothetical protein
MAAPRGGPLAHPEWHALFDMDMDKEREATTRKRFYDMAGAAAAARNGISRVVSIS